MSYLFEERSALIYSITADPTDRMTNPLSALISSRRIVTLFVCAFTRRARSKISRNENLTHGLLIVS